jgi:hypothetical protein
VEFYWAVSATAEAVAFTLDEATATPEDRVTDLSGSLNYTDVANFIYVRGRDRQGNSASAVYQHTLSSGSASYHGYTGRKLLSIRDEPDNPAPDRAAKAEVLLRTRIGGEISWATIGRALLPGAVVAVDVAHLKIPSGTEYRVTERRISYNPNDSNAATWQEVYACIRKG